MSLIPNPLAILETREFHETLQELVRKEVRYQMRKRAQKTKRFFQMTGFIFLVILGLSLAMTIAGVLITFILNWVHTPQ